MTTTDRLNALATAWGDFMLRGLVEGTIFLLIVGVAWLLFRKRMSAQLAHGLFLLVLARLAVPIPITVPASWLGFATGSAVGGPAGIEAVEDRLALPVQPAPRLAGATAPDLAPGSTVAEAGPAPVAARVGALSVGACSMIGWGAVVLCLFARLVAGHLAMHRMLRDVRRLDRGELAIDLLALARRAGLRSPVRVLEVPWIDSPCVWGPIRPCILVPPGLAGTLSANGMTWVLLHELAHIRRGDARVALFQRLVQIAYFFHPAVWVANRMIDAQREYACDDVATAIADVPRRDCGTGFLAIVERANAATTPRGMALGLIRSQTLIRSRLMRILDVRRPLSTGLSLGSSVALLAFAAIGLPQIRAVEEPPKPVPATADREASGPISASPIAREFEAREAAEPAALRVVSGVIRDREGSPVEGVGISATLRGQEIDFDNGNLREIYRRNRPFTWTGPGGRYRLPPEGKGYVLPEEEPAFGLFAAHEKGYARKSAVELARSADITLEPWGRVEGTVTILGKLQTNVPVRLTLDATDQHSMFYDFYEYDVRTDDRGRFAIGRVPAGLAMVRTGGRQGTGPGPFGVVSAANRMIRAGETLRLDVGGAGRPVEGRLKVPGGLPATLWVGELVRKTNLPPGPPKLSDEAMQGMKMEQKFRHHFDPYRSPEGLARRLAERTFPVEVNPDGTFRAVEVEPDTYILSFRIEKGVEHPNSTREVVVPPDPEGRPDRPFDVGTFEIKLPGSN